MGNIEILFCGILGVIGICSTHGYTPDSLVTFNRIIRGVVDITIQQNCKVSKDERIKLDNIYEVPIALKYFPARAIFNSLIAEMVASYIRAN